MNERAITALLVVSVLVTSLGLCATEVAETANIVEIATASEDFENLALAVQTAGLEETLSSDGPFTVFAPADEAFEALPEGTLPSLLENTEALSEVLLYHVASGKLMAADVMNQTEIPTLLEGASLAVNVTDAGVTIEGVAILQTDIVASNGIIHVIDAVLIPPFEEEMVTEEEEEDAAPKMCVSNTTRELLLSLNINSSRFESLTACPPETETKTDPTCLSETPCD